jgi:hypothetical protein
MWDLCDGPAAQFGCELGMNLQATGGSPAPLGGRHPQARHMLETAVAYFVVLALGFGVGYGVRELVSSKRHRRSAERRLPH